MLIELLQPLGPELVRRWVAALLAVDRDEREQVVAMIEQQIAREYSSEPDTRASVGAGTQQA